MGRKSEITAIIRSLLNRRSRMRKDGSIAAADELAARINLMIAENLRRRLQKVADANIADVWNAIRPKRCSDRKNRTSHLLADLEFWTT